MMHGGSLKVHCWFVTVVDFHLLDVLVNLQLRRVVINVV